MIKKSVFCLTAILILLLTLFACGQQDIFFTIASETAPKKPRVDGAPSNMVVFNRTPKTGGSPTPVMYVASGNNLYWYAKDPSSTTPPTYGWNLGVYDTPKLPGKIRSLAVAGTYLYALCDPGLFRIPNTITSSTTWEAIGSDASAEYPNLQNIFADNGQLFAGANNGGKYGILYLDTSNKLKKLADDTELLSGVAYSNPNYFLSTRGKGVYSFGTLTPTPNPPQLATSNGDKNLLIAGMIRLNATTVIAIERDGGTLYKVAAGGLTHAGGTSASPTVVKTGKYATGALAEYKYNDGTAKQILVVGVQGVLFNTTSSYSHGYMEFKIETGDILEGPNEPTVTVVSGNQYTSSIGKRPINFMFQPTAVDNTEMLFFASTQTTGLWSFRFRDGVWQWNAEGDNEPE